MLEDTPTESLFYSQQLAVPHPVTIFREMHKIWGRNYIDGQLDTLLVGVSPPIGGHISRGPIPEWVEVADSRRDSLDAEELNEPGGHASVDKNCEEDDGHRGGTDYLPVLGGRIPGS